MLVCFRSGHPTNTLHVNKYTWENLIDSDESSPKQKPFVSVSIEDTLARYKKVPGVIKTIMVSIGSKYMKFSEALLYHVAVPAELLWVANSGSQPPHSLWVVTSTTNLYINVLLFVVQFQFKFPLVLNWNLKSANG